MNYKTFVGTAHITAGCCAAIAALGAAIGFRELSDSWLVSGLIGAGTAVVLGLGWFAVMGAASATRRHRNVGMIAMIGLFLTLVAIAVSGWSLATALGGKSAQRMHQQAQTTQHEAALAAAYKRVTDQEPLLTEVVTAQTVYTGYAEDETRRGGCGPRCQTYRSMGDTMTSVRAGLQGQMEQAASRRREAEAALAQARLGQDVEANLALVASTVSHLNAIDLATGPVGMVRYTAGAEGVSNVATDEVTQALIAADADLPEPVAVPVYEKISNAEATLRYAGRVAGAWAAALGIDCAPFLLLLLVIALWSEPLLREEKVRKAKPTDDDIRDREESVKGKVVTLKGN
jgi:hypothetical protein